VSITFAAADLDGWPRVEAELDRLGYSYYSHSVLDFARPRVYFGPEELIGEGEILEALPRFKQLLDPEAER
jgi:hypothetical protein